MNRSSQVLRLLSQACAITLMLFLFGCSGGGGVGGGTSSSLLGGIGGTGIKGPVGNATVTAYAINNGAMGAQIGTGTTDALGNFNLSIGSYTGAVMLQLGGGTYTDEATGTTMPMAPGDVMTAVLTTVAAGSTISGIQMTPLTSMAQVLALHTAGGMTDTNIAAANAAIGNAYKVTDLLHTPPMNPLVSGSGSTATQDMINYGITLAAISQYAKNQGMSSSSAMVTALMNDVSDGIMDGRMTGSTVTMGGMAIGVAMPSTAGTSGLAAAMTTFMASAQNRSGLTVSNMQTLMNQLNSSNGQVNGASGMQSPVIGLVSGSAFNGVVSQATVKAFAINNGALGAQIASTTTDNQGNFTMPLGSYAGPVMLQVSGATYTDEATGKQTTMASSDVMTSVLSTINSGSTVTGVWVTPLTSMAQARAQALSGGMIDANIVAANSAIGNYFTVSDILHSQPMNPLVSGSGNTATLDMKNHGLAVAAMSQYAKSLGEPVSSAMITAMMSDASDGIMNGKMGSASISMGSILGAGGMMVSRGSMLAIAGTSDLATAMTNFLNSAENLSGLTPAGMAALIQHLNSSNGQI